MNPPRHLPYLNGDSGLAMGLRPLDPACWLETGDDFAAQMAEREILLRDRRPVVVALEPDTETAQQDVLDLVMADLASHRPGLYDITGCQARCRTTGREIPLDGDAPLVTAARLVQEDFCLMRNGPEGYSLAAAVVCFPSRWSLASKIGRPIAAIHGPVPGYAEKLARPVDRFFDMLKPDRPVWRANWSLHDRPDLHQPGGENRLPPVVAPTVPEELWIRVERQTLRRLDCGDVLFTIRTHVDPLTAISGLPDARRGMAKGLREMPEGLQGYKNVRVWRDAALDWLENG